MIALTPLVHNMSHTWSAYMKVGYGQVCETTVWLERTIQTFCERAEPLETGQAATEVSGCTLRLKGGLHPHGKCSHTKGKGRSQFRRSLYSLGKHINALCNRVRCRKL